MSKINSLVWFRRDLRTGDNPALTAACENTNCLPVYIVDTQNNKDWSQGEASRWWLHHSLNSLNENLDGRLQCFVGDPKKILPTLVKHFSIEQVHWNRCYEPWQIKRDKYIKAELANNNIEVHSYNASLLWEPWAVAKKDGTPYKVFTPYYRNGCLKLGSPRYPVGKPQKPVFIKNRHPDAVSIDDLGLLPKIQWYSGFEDHWQPGEKGAGKKLSRFLRNALNRYKDQRNIPSVSGTSKLSPHLHFGEMSPNQAWYAALNACDHENENLESFLSELGWREFSYYLLFHNPDLPTKNFNTRFDNFPWSNNHKQLKAWQQGQTGIPIVDAGMRELWQTGYMHNRVRMIVASFLVKNLMIDWRNGEKWFWDTLVDADLAANSASWQWVAGSGADAAPYFRIFNPVTQGQRFDPQGAYVRHYCPELSTLTDKYIHQPWEAPEAILEQAGITLGETYPKPLVSLKASRENALAAYKQLGNKS